MSRSLNSKYSFACLAAAVVAPSASFAADASAVLPGVVVTASRQPSRVEQLVADVTVLTREDIERAEGHTLVELLSQQSGIQISTNGGRGKPASVYLRGMDARHVLLLVDGVRTGSATLGLADFDNISLDEIERIEIVRGPLASLYGSDAVAGVVQLFTRRPGPGTELRAKLAAGSNSYGQGAAGLSWSDGDFSLAAQAQHTEDDGFSATNERNAFGFNPDRDPFRQDSASLRGGLKLPAGWLAELQGLYSEADSSYDEGPGADSRARLRNRQLNATLQGPVSPGWKTLVRAARAQNDYITLESNFPGSLGRIFTVQDQFSWENTVATPIGSVLGVVEHLRQDVGKPAPDYDETLRINNAVAVGLDGSAAAHVWQASLRHDHNSQFGGQTTGAAGYGYDFAPGWRATVQYGTSFIAPNFNDLYYPGFGNPELEPEEGKHAELGVRWAAGAHTARAAWVDNRIRRYITQGPDPVNVDARIDGLVLAWETRYDAWQFAASLDHLDPRNDTAGSPQRGRQLSRRAKNALRLAGDVDLGAASLGATFAAFSQRYEYDDFSAPPVTTRLGGYATLDLRADWRLDRQWTLGARVNNVADKAYETALGYNQPGREFYVTLRYASR